MKTKQQLLLIGSILYSFHISLWQYFQKIFSKVGLLNKDIERGLAILGGLRDIISSNYMKHLALYFFTRYH